ncbi:hypothetical protein FS837_011251 [Tulasnella sp. UAMH 9824]|nr:hypothetical protein FS837_011251 [Tulasnella sp. UAMH 9824]
MTQQRTPGKAWTNSEDEKLITAVQKYGENTESWKTIAEAVPGRTNKACRKRWKHSLHPSIKKTPWEPEEDELLLKLNAQHPGRWALIANHITGRTDDACAKRYREALDPNLKKDDWTKEEDEQLLDGYSRHGASWGKIGEDLGRSGLGCRNRWRLLERRKNATERRKAKPVSAGSSKPRKPKRKRESTEEDTADGELSDSEEPQAGPSQSHRAPAKDRIRPPPSRSNTAESTPVEPISPDPCCPTLDAVETPPTVAGGQAIDPAIIGMALGKCPCGCASGTNPCTCSSTNPSLNLNPDPNLIDSLDWNQLFPYLQAELPTVFVEPPPIHAAPSSNPPALANMFQGTSALQGPVGYQGKRCNCTSPGCCSSDQTKSSCCSSQQGSGSCCQPNTSAPTLSNGNLAPSDRTLPESDAEAAKLVLDYATFLLQRQHVPSTANPPPQHAPIPSSHSLDRNSLPSASCQTPASHLLIGIIEKYQQQKSAPSSNATSGLLPNIPLPNGSAGCGCGCGDATISSAKDAPEPYFSAVTEAGSISFQNPVDAPPASIETGNQGSSDHAPSGSCCGGDKEENNTVIQSMERHQPSTDSSSSAIPAYYHPSIETAPIPTLPSYVPGCTCGCASGTPAGSCSCGCVGICLCGFQDFGSLELAPKPTDSDPNALLGLSTAIQTVEQPAKRGGCCGGKSKQPVAEALNPDLVMSIPPTSAIPLEEASLPSFIPGCECGCAAGIDAGACTCGCIGVCCCASKLLEVEPATLTGNNQLAIGLAEPRGSEERTIFHSRNPSLETTASCCSPSTSTTATNTPKLAHTPSIHRLSAQLPAPLPAYACGHPDCWRPTPLPQQSMHELAAVSFHTSAELMEHRRIVHGAEVEATGGLGRGTGPSGSWLFRCGLAGCEKGWKSINGMQYHLQLSRVHFAGSSREPDTPEDQVEKGTALTISDDVPRSTSAVKAFKCPRPGCTNAYKQAAGLKYHLAHGHPAVQPVQFGAL